MPLNHTRLRTIAEEVKALNDKDQQLAKLREKTKVEQRDLRFDIADKAAKLTTDEEFAFVAEVSGLAVARLRDYIFVRAQWPKGTFPADVHYTALEELARDPERFDKIKSGMSKRDARAAKGGRVDTPSRWTPDVKAAYVREALADPEVARQVASDRAARTAMAEAEWERQRERQAQAELASPGRKAMRETTEKLELLRSLDSIHYAIGRAVAKAQELELGGDQDLIAAAADVVTAAGWLSEYAAGGATGFDDALARLLEENR